MHQKLSLTLNIGMYAGSDVSDTEDARVVCRQELHTSRRVWCVQHGNRCSRVPAPPRPHWLALRQEKSTGRWFLHDNQEVQLIQDHKAYIEKLVAKSEDDWAIPLRSMSLRLHIDIDAIFFVITHHVIIPL